MEATKIRVKKHDIVDYVIGNSSFDPIEKCIDPIRYEVFDTFIFDKKSRQDIPQGKKFCKFEKELIKLKTYARKMDNSEIDSICTELEEIAPSFLNLF